MPIKAPPGYFNYPDPMPGTETHYQTLESTPIESQNFLENWPTLATCAVCRSRGITRINFEPNKKTHCFAALLCMLGCWCCICIPYVTSSFQTVVHRCRSCGSYVGSFRSE